MPIVVAGLVAWTLVTGVGEMKARRTESHVRVAAAIDGLAAEDDILVLAWPLYVESYYLQHPYLHGITALEDLSTLAALHQAGAFGRRSLLYVLPDLIAAQHEGLLATVGSVGATRRMDADELRIGHPYIAEILGATGLNLVRIG